MASALSCGSNREQPAAQPPAGPPRSLAGRREAERRIKAGHTQGDGGAGIGEEDAQRQAARGRREDGEEERLGVAHLRVRVHTGLRLRLQRAVHGHDAPLLLLQRSPATHTQRPDRRSVAIGPEHINWHIQGSNRLCCLSELDLTRYENTPPHTHTQRGRSLRTAPVAASEADPNGGPEAAAAADRPGTHSGEKRWMMFLLRRRPEHDGMLSMALMHVK